MVFVIARFLMGISSSVASKSSLFASRSLLFEAADATDARLERVTLLVDAMGFASPSCPSISDVGGVDSLEFEALNCAVEALVTFDNGESVVSGFCFRLGRAIRCLATEGEETVWASKPRRV